MGWTAGRECRRASRSRQAGRPVDGSGGPEKATGKAPSDEGVPLRSLSDLFRNFLQIGYVTDDLDTAAAYLEEKLGTVEVVKHYRSNMGGGKPPWEGGAPGESFVVVDGTTADDWTIDVLLVNAGATNIEIMKPVSGAVDHYRGLLRPDVPATVHHLGFTVDDFDEASKVVEAAGRQWAQFGATGDIRFGYLDLTAELGPNSAANFARLEAASNVDR